MQFQEKFERVFASWGRFVVRRYWLVLVTTLAATAYLITWLPQLTVDNSTESFLRPNDSARKHYDALREQFGQDERIVVTVEGPAVFDLSYLNTLRDFHRDIEAEVPYVLEITSLLNARSTRGDDDRLVVEDLMAEWPKNAAEVQRLADRVRETPLYENTLINPAATVTTVTIKPLIYSTHTDEDDVLAGFGDDAVGGEEQDAAPEFLTGSEKVELHEALSAVMERFRTDEFRLGLAGGGVLNIHATKMMMRDIKVFMSGCVLVVAVLLFTLFRRLSGVLLPTVTVLSSLLVTYGIMAWIGIPASLTGQVLPMLLITVGVCSAVHILTIVYQRLEAGETKADAVVFALGHSGLAVMMATLTTAGGLFSFVSAELAQIANLGKVAPLGIILTFIYSMTMLPALLMIFPMRRTPRLGGAALRAALRHRVVSLADFSARNPWSVVAGSVLVVAVFGTGITQIRFSQNGIMWFPEEDPIRKAVEFMNREFRGAGGLEFVIDTGSENGLHDPDMLNRIERAMDFSESLDGGEIWVGKTVSIVDIVKETHKALNENRPSHYVIPQDRKLLAQELLLFENSGSDDLEELTDSRFQLARISLRTPFADGMHTPPFVERLERGFREILGEDVGIQATGLGVLFGRTFSMVNPTLAKSYLLALLIITPLMVLLIGNIGRGLLAMIPNLIPIWMTLGLMGWLDIPLDNSSLLIGCIIIGLAVDDTIHFMHRFQRYFAGCGDARLAVRRTLETTGTALLFTTLVLASGFAVMMLAYMTNIAEIGMLAAFGTLVAFLADIVVSPALMVLATRGEPLAVRMAHAGAVAGGSDPDRQAGR